MARQTVGNPKFYIDLLSNYWAKGNVKGVGFDHEGQDTHIIGQSGYNPKFIGLNPSDYARFTGEYEYTNLGSYAESIRIELRNGQKFSENHNDNFFFGFLGHSFHYTKISGFKVNFIDHNGEVALSVSPENYQEICNIENGADGHIPYNGWSLAQWTGAVVDHNIFSIQFELNKESSQTNNATLLGSLCFGTVFQMPHSPDLNLTMSREYEGTREQTTIGGSTLTEIDYYRAADWGGYSAWELYQENPFNMIDGGIVESRAASKGRRVWELKFSYIDGDDLFPASENFRIVNPTDSFTNSNAGYTSDDFYEGLDGLKKFAENSRTSNSFLTRLMGDSIGGALPFIFQPDGNNNSPDQFAICKLDQSSFKFKAVANNVYDVSLRIREVW